MTNRNMKYGWKLNTRYSALAKLSDKIGPKTDPLCFMNRSNLSFKARIFVKRFKITHKENLLLENSTPLRTPLCNTCEKNAVVTRRR